MNDKTLSKARGLNSIANPRDFKGASGRGRPGTTATPPPPPPGTSPGDGPDTAEPEPVESPPTAAPTAAPDARSTGDTPAAPGPTSPPPHGAPVEAAAAGPASSLSPPAAPGGHYQPEPSPIPAAATPRRAVTPGLNRKRRELTVPTPVAEALDRTGINPADVVMAGYRRHADTIYGGGGGRMLARGRTRLRLSISDTEFEQLTRLGEARGWNRSEVVSVILAMELLPAHPITPR